ncbi:uroporphyrinogen-III synthase [Paraoerskovia marina]|uniref:Uroporphyrinogen-III synthase n=1 Tax=Paraoerskovia marina TaxID=545619 RepID=A0A1H1M3V8_9CELL|nr:uroporphyrinogen-III synthase [Paraoerskovia marina]SDR81182.1 uroporphyrinogen-III synthase [Paraoerskovia marina]
MTELSPDRLDGVTVLIPRSPSRAAALTDRLQARGARVIVSAVISRAPIEDTAPVDDAVTRLREGGFRWVAVTSVNAIDELVAAAARQATTLAEIPVRWAAVGRATARALEATGVEVAFRPTEASGAALAAELPGEPGDHADQADATVAPSVLLPLGDLATPTAAVGLRERGFDPHVVTVYRTVAHPVSREAAEAWQAGDVDVVVLTSGSVAREVASQLGPHACVAGVTIGEPTARAARDVHVRVDEVAASADDDGLEAAVLDVIAARLAADTPEHGDTALAPEDEVLPVRTPHLTPQEEL